MSIVNMLPQSGSAEPVRMNGIVAPTVSSSDLFTCSATGKLYMSIIVTRHINFPNTHDGNAIYGVDSAVLKLTSNGTTTTFADSRTASQYVPDPNDDSTFYKRFIIDGMNVTSGDVISYTQSNQNSKKQWCAIWEGYIIP
jgi:hypothetical protein